jgi:hypothetical protein
MAAVLAAAEVGATWEQAERLRTLAILLFGEALDRRAEALGLTDGIHADREAVLAWRERVNWPAVFGLDGASLVTGESEAGSPVELEAETDTDAETEGGGDRAAAPRIVMRPPPCEPAPSRTLLPICPKTTKSLKLPSF